MVMKKNLLLLYTLVCTLTVVAAAKEESYKAVVKFGDLTESFRDLDHTFTRVEYIEEDRLNPGNFILADKHALVYLSSNGTVTSLVGQTDKDGYQEGSGKNASFNFLAGFVQYNETDIAVADVLNHCIRNVKRDGWTTSPFIGECLQLRCSDHPTNITDPLLTLLCYPLMMVFDSAIQTFYLNSYGDGRIYSYNLETNLIALLAYYKHDLGTPSAILLSSDRSILYAAHDFGLSTIDIASGNLTLLTGGTEIRNDDQIVDTQQSSSLADARYNSPCAGLAWLIPDQVLLFGDPKSKALRVIDFTQDHVEAVCKGEKDSAAVIWGPTGTCAFREINHVRRINDTIYIVELDEEKDSSSFGTMTIEVPECVSPPSPENGYYEPVNSSYSNLAELTFHCNTGYAINTTYDKVHCTGLPSKWSEVELPGCVPVAVSDVTPLQSQRLGGTSVTVIGNLPSATQVFLGYQTAREQEMNFTERDFHKLTFRMPAQSSDDNENITIVLDNNKTATFEFKYLPNPQVTSIQKSTTILSGGVNIEFAGEGFNAAYEYKLVLNVSNGEVESECAYNIAISENILCQTMNVSDFVDDNSSEWLLQGHLVGDTHTVADSSGVITVYADPTFDNFTDTPKEITVGQSQVLTLTGQRLNKATKVEDYRVTIGNVGLCSVVDLNAETLECQPEQTPTEPNDETQSIEVQVAGLVFSPGEVLFLQPPTTGPTRAELEYIIPISIICFIVVILAVVMLLVWRRRRANRRNMPIIDEMQINRVAVRREDDEWYLSMSIDLRYRLRDVAIDPSDLTYNPRAEPIGKGNFGNIFLGQLKVQGGKILKTVAVKALKDSQDVDSIIVESFLKEATLLLGFQHVNILGTLGVVWQVGERPLAVLPYMGRGDLRSMIKNETYEFTNGDLLHFCMQIAAGMEYLAGSKFVHRDLAARNCLVDQDYLVKVADFGLSRDIYENDYYKDSDKQRPRPVKWMALESLLNGVYTTQTDVWAYGVTMWEVCMRGTTPYPGVDNPDVLRFLSSGQRLQKPAYTHPDVYGLMSRCWLADPRSRPTFTEINQFLHMCLDSKPEPVDGQTYSYKRDYTATIPGDYVNQDAYRRDMTPDYADYLKPIICMKNEDALSFEEETNLLNSPTRVHGLESLVAGGVSSPTNDYVGNCLNKPAVHETDQQIHKMSPCTAVDMSSPQKQKPIPSERITECPHYVQ